MATPNPKPTAPGRNSYGRTPAEQADWERLQNSKKIGQNDRNPLMDFLGQKRNVKDPIFGARLAAGKKMYEKAKAKKNQIPPSPTH